MLRLTHVRVLLRTELCISRYRASRGGRSCHAAVQRPGTVQYTQERKEGASYLPGYPKRNARALCSIVSCTNARTHIIMGLILKPYPSIA